MFESYEEVMDMLMDQVENDQEENVLEEIKNFTAIINSLFTKENARELMESVVSGINNLSNSVKEDISKNIVNIPVLPKLIIQLFWRTI